MGMFAEALKKGAVRVAASIDVEKDSTSRAIARANHKVDHHSLAQDLWQVTEADIDRLIAKYGRIDLIIATTPCQGLSKANDAGAGLKDNRSSLFYKAIEIIQVLQKKSPKTKFIVENVDFRKSHPEDYAEVCTHLGTPEFIDAKNSSGANRKRLFWHNLGQEQQRHREGDRPRNANELLEDGATLKGGATTAPCIMATWACTHQDCAGRGGHDPCSHPEEHQGWQHMRTHAPVTVMQDGRERSLRPQEAERLMGLPEDYTSQAQSADGTKHAVAGLHRLQRIGGGIDVRSVQTLARRLAESQSSPPEHEGGHGHTHRRRPDRRVQPRPGPRGLERGSHRALADSRWQHNRQ
jgi:site-specific DNA-cytosine methylase